MSILESPLVFVDIETNGISATRGRIIEVAAIRYENGQVVSSLNYLLNPGTRIPEFITGLTGITNADVAKAPAFEDISKELLEIMNGAVFVAHNVRFDYSFIKQELSRVGIKFNSKQLCTVKLSRTMFPDQAGHKLQNLIDRCNLKVRTRHRAYDDADAMRQFIDHLKQTFPVELINKALSRQIQSPALPKNLPLSLIKSLPEGPGVYIFQDSLGNPLYIGKSVNIKNRVLNHFSQDFATESEFKISQNIADIEFHITAGELGALLLESKLIKEMQPLFNRRLRRTQKLTIARTKLTDSGYISVHIEDTEAIDPLALDDILSVYTTKGQAKKFLDELCKTYGFCPRLMGLEKGNGPCFAYQIKKCRGACVNLHAANEHNELLLDLFKKKKISQWPFTSPVLIQEITANTDDCQSIVVDNWCVIADISQPEHCSPSINFYKHKFDIDTYKILKSYIDTKRSRLNIQPITARKLQELAAVTA